MKEFVLYKINEYNQIHCKSKKKKLNECYYHELKNMTKGIWRSKRRIWMNVIIKNLRIWQKVYEDQKQEITLIAQMVRKIKSKQYDEYAPQLVLARLMNTLFCLYLYYKA